MNAFTTRPERARSGLPPAEADITAENEHRPHLVKIKYRGRRGAGGCIARMRITAHVITDDTPGGPT